MIPIIREVYIAGDSIVDGYGASALASRTVEQLKLHVAAAFHSPVAVTPVFGVSGGSLAQITAALTALKPVSWPDIVVIEDAATTGVLGDGGTGADPIATWLTTMQTAIDTILANWGKPGARPFVLVCNLWNPTGNVSENTVNGQLATLVESYGGAVGLVDIYSISQSTRAHGLQLSATNTGGDTTWQIQSPSTAYGNGKAQYIADIQSLNPDELYLVNLATGSGDSDAARWGSVISDIASDGSTISTNDAPAGAIASPVNVRICQKMSSWRKDAIWGDDYHPNNNGYFLIEEAVLDAVSAWRSSGCKWVRGARA